MIFTTKRNSYFTSAFPDQTSWRHKVLVTRRKITAWRQDTGCKWGQPHYHELLRVSISYFYFM